MVDKHKNADAVRTKSRTIFLLYATVLSIYGLACILHGIQEGSDIVYSIIGAVFLLIGYYILTVTYQPFKKC